MTGPAFGTFFLGANPHFLAHTDVPLFIAHPRLAGRRTFPRACGPFAVDSGGFTQLSREGSWDTGPSPRAYIRDLCRYRDEIGHLAWAAPQDWMCEDAIIHGGPVGSQFFPGTGLSVEEHLRRTVGNYLDLRSLDPTLPIIPVVQGRRPADYTHCIDLYTQAGIDLLQEPVVGIGSVCRIQATDEAVEIVRAVTDILGPGRCHGFGIKITGLRKIAHLLASADSHAWSAQGRRVPAGACMFRLPRSPGPHKNEANCLRFALSWRRRALAAADNSLLTAKDRLRPHRRLRRMPCYPDHSLEPGYLSTQRTHPASIRYGGVARLDSRRRNEDGFTSAGRHRWLLYPRGHRPASGKPNPLVLVAGPPTVRISPSPTMLNSSRRPSPVHHTDLEVAR